MSMQCERSGSAPYGNFKQYYNFNPADKRVKLLPRNILGLFHHTKDVAVLDIGCNIGKLTVGFYNHLVQDHNFSGKSVHILAIDIDPDLIIRAKESNPYPNNIEYVALDIMGETAQKVLDQYIERFKKVKFDLTLCFSVTMWLHLNHGDTGLEKFLKFVSSATQYLLLEPQNWKCYMSASRRMRRLNSDKFQDLRKLSVTRVTAENIDGFLNEKCEMRKISEFGVTDWKRNVLLYRHIEVPDMQIVWQWT